jgi:hypothetical protein
MRFTYLVRFVMFALVLLVVSCAASAQVRVAIRIGPPPLVVYEQPICPGDGYIWTPGFWSYDYDAGDYFWVPGTWVLAPEVGFLWTPGYWGWGDDGFLWYDGYWGPEIGFYGGINYGFGYFGTGYYGGRWDHGHFFYNTTINHIDVTVIHNVYNERVNESTFTRVSFNGGNGGVNARPSAREEAYAHETHTPRVAAQNEHIQAARSDPQQRFSANHGAPAVAATPRPGALRDSGVVRARNDAGANHPNPVHPNELPAMEHPAAPNTGNPKTDQKYQQQQEKLMAKQQQDRQKLQQQQDKEHQQMAKQSADDARKQQVEQKHAQQTQQLQQRHTQQQQQLQQRQAPPPSRPQASQPKPH